MDKSLVQLTASEVVEGLKKGEISPLELISAAETRILETEPAINALPTLCLVVKKKITKIDRIIV